VTDQIKTGDCSLWAMAGFFIRCPRPLKLVLRSWFSSSSAVGFELSGKAFELRAMMIRCDVYFGEFRFLVVFCVR